MLRSQYRDRFQIAAKLATRTIDLRRALLDYRPQIVHFSGHGTGETGLVLENDAGKVQLVSTEALAGLFGIFEACDISCVLLNACYSEVQATAIHQFVDCVIGMNQPIGDKSAIQFAEGFYDALGSGSNYDEAYKIGCSAIALEGSSEYSIPVLKYRKRRSETLTENQLLNQSSQPDQVSAVTSKPSAQISQSQTFGSITISGNNNPFNAIQSENDVAVNQSYIQPTVTNSSLQAALQALNQLKQAINATDALDDIDKEMLAIPIQKLEGELQKSHPNWSVVDKAIASLNKALDGVLILSEPMKVVATLITKVCFPQ